MPVLNQYSFQCWHGTAGMVLYHASTDGQLPVKFPFGAAPVVGRAYASTEPVQFSVLAWYHWHGLVSRQYRWTTFSQVTFRSRSSGRPCLCQHYASTTTVLQILLRYWRGTQPVVNFHLAYYTQSYHANTQKGTSQM